MFPSEKLCFGLLCHWFAVSLTNTPHLYDSEVIIVYIFQQQQNNIYIMFALVKLHSNNMIIGQ